MRRYFPSTAHLWPLVVWAGLGFYVSLVPLPPNDFWWHLKIGELIYTRRAIPSTQMFAWSLPPDVPFVYGAWLGELLLYLLYRLGGLNLVTFARNALILAAFGLVGWAARIRSRSWRLAAPALALAGGMSLNNLVVRPRIWSFPLFALYLLLLTRYVHSGGARPRDRWALLALPPLMALWVNAHGAFILGLVLVGIFVVGEGLRALLRLPEPLPWRAVGWLALIGALTAAAILVNPRGVGIVAYVADLLTDRPSQALVVEWQSPTPSGIPNVVFYVSILVLMLTLAYARRRPAPTDALLIVGFLWLAWSGMRYVVWYGMAVMPVLAEMWASLSPRGDAPRPPEHAEPRPDPAPSDPRPSGSAVVGGAGAPAGDLLETRLAGGAGRGPHRGGEPAGRGRVPPGPSGWPSLQRDGLRKLPHLGPAGTAGLRGPAGGTLPL